METIAWSENCPFCGKHRDPKDTHDTLLNLLLRGDNLSTEELMWLQYSDDDSQKVYEGKIVPVSVALHPDCYDAWKEHGFPVPENHGFSEVLNWKVFPLTLLIPKNFSIHHNRRVRKLDQTAQ